MLIFFTSLFFITRTLLILTGRLKGPIIHLFERYGGNDPHFYPWPMLFIWCGIAWISGHLMMTALIGSGLPGVYFSISFWILSFLMWHYEQRIRQLPYFHWTYPTWLRELWERTERQERRRIAYMWLRLSWKARLAYNSSDQAFDHWADMIILGTLF
jgi:hypothetical protein